MMVSARKILGLKLHEVRLHRHSLWTHTHLLLLQLPSLQRNRVYEGQHAAARSGKHIQRETKISLLPLFFIYYAAVWLVIKNL